ncbi:hypothetical protein FQN52_004769 [Onygenales sp. PD_12]|nr:hypothetical protein FQN51_004211 [Onygenales sp. PD_10]KAK2791578.1 hypothetical protein FQN52_004769 [Onygenales sp. PD_12]
MPALKSFIVRKVDTQQEEAGNLAPEGFEPRFDSANDTVLAIQSKEPLPGERHTLESIEKRFKKHALTSPRFVRPWS